MANKSFGLGNVTAEVGGALGKVMQYRMSQQARQDALNMMQRKQQFERQKYMTEEQGKVERHKADLAAQKEQTDALLKQREMQHKERMAAEAAQTSLQGKRLDLEKKRDAASNFNEFYKILDVNVLTPMEQTQYEMKSLTNPMTGMPNDPLQFAALQRKMQILSDLKLNMQQQYYGNGGLSNVLKPIEESRAKRQQISEYQQNLSGTTSLANFPDVRNRLAQKRSGLNEPPKTSKPQQNEKIEVINPEGKRGYVPKSYLDEALQRGYKKVE